MYINRISLSLDADFCTKIKDLRPYEKQKWLISAVYVRFTECKFVLRWVIGRTHFTQCEIQKLKNTILQGVNLYF